MVIKGAHRIKKTQGGQICGKPAKMLSETTDSVFHFCIHQHCKSSNYTEFNFMDESFLGEGTDSRLCILITTGNIQSNLLPVYFLNWCSVQLLARNQPHYCRVGNCNSYLHNSSGQSFPFHNMLLS